MNVSTSDLIVSAVAFAVAFAGGYLMRTGIRGGNRSLVLTGAVAVIVFGLAGLVSFARAF